MQASAVFEVGERIELELDHSRRASGVVKSSIHLGRAEAAVHGRLHYIVRLDQPDPTLPKVMAMPSAGWQFYGSDRWACVPADRVHRT